MDATQLSIVWMVVAATLVLFMQAGFATLEAGLTRPKNAANIAVVKLTDTISASVLFWICGFGFMYGRSAGGLIGTSSFFVPDGVGATSLARFLLQILYCTTAAAIFSGAVAERLTFKAQVIASAIFIAAIYPLFGHWALVGWLGQRGFTDYAGATWVHSLGGWMALSALLAVGNRTGRYSRTGKVLKIAGSSVPLATLGTFVLILGWMGWLGGAARDLGLLGRIEINALLAATGGGLAVLVGGWILTRLVEIEPLMKGTLAGLVAVSASCPWLAPATALLVGAVGGLVMLAVDGLLDRLRLDDAVSAVPVHLGGGLWGTLAAGIFSGHGLSLGPQLLGMGACAVWGFGTSFVLFKVLGTTVKLRVSREDEFAGLNASEHQAGSELMDIMDAFEETARQQAVDNIPIVEPFTEVAQLAYNAEGFITYSNPAASAIFGYGERELRKVKITQLFAPARRGAEAGDEGVMDLDTVRRSFSENRQEARGLRRTGEDFPMEVSVGFAGVAGSDAQIEAMTLKDITARKDKEAGLSRTQLAIRRSLNREIEESSHVVKGATLGRDAELPAAQIAMNVATGEHGDFFGYFYDAGNSIVTLYAGDAKNQAASPLGLLSAVDSDEEEGEYTHGLLLGDAKYLVERQLRNLADVFNRIILAAGKGELVVAMSFLHVDLKTGDATLLGAGRVAPILVKSGKALKEVRCGGTALGSSSNPEFEFKTLSISVDDCVVAYSSDLVGTYGPDGKIMHERELKKVVLSRDHVKDIRDEILTRGSEVWKQRTQELHSVLAFKRMLRSE